MPPKPRALLLVGQPELPAGGGLGQFAGTFQPAVVSILAAVPDWAAGCTSACLPSSFAGSGRRASVRAVRSLVFITSLWGVRCPQQIDLTLLWTLSGSIRLQIVPVGHRQHHSARLLSYGTPLPDPVEIVTAPIPRSPLSAPLTRRSSWGQSLRRPLTRSRSCCYRASSTGCWSGGIRPPTKFTGGSSGESPPNTVTTTNSLGKTCNLTYFRR